MGEVHDGTGRPEREGVLMVVARRGRLAFPPHNITLPTIDFTCDSWKTRASAAWKADEHEKPRVCETSIMSAIEALYIYDEHKYVSNAWEKDCTITCNC